MTVNKPPQENQPRPEKLFKPPDGYVFRWRLKGTLGNGATGGFALIDPQGHELGYFEMLQNGGTIMSMLKSHMKPRIMGKTRETIKVVIEFTDSGGKAIGSWNIQEQPNNEIEAMIKDLSER